MASRRSLVHRAEVALLRARGEVGAGGADDDAAPLAVTAWIARRVGQRVLRRLFVGDLRVDALELGGAGREERAAARLLGDLLEHELGFGEAAVAEIAAAVADRVDDRLGALGEVE